MHKNELAQSRTKSSHMKLLVSHPTGNANLREVIRAFDEAGILAEFETCIAADANSKMLKWLPASVRSEFLRREFPVDTSKIKTYAFRELLRLGLSRIGLTHFTQHETGAFSVDSVYRSFDKAVSNRLRSLANSTGVQAVYAYEDGALHTFETAKSLELPCYYDLPIGYWRSARKLLGVAADKSPEWAPTLSGFRDSKEKLKRKDDELAMADHIFVASSFTRKSLELYPGTLPPISVVPYGFPPVGEGREYIPLENRPLKMLFVGGLSQRKGIANVLEAAEIMGDRVELTIIGRKPQLPCEPLERGLAKCRYIPSLSHTEVLAQMRTADVLVFPSLFEGFGLVITESMSQGTPVITTDRTCGPEFIKHNENGWFVNADDTDALVVQLDDILSAPERLSEVGRKARNTALEKPWTSYGRELVEKIEHVHTNRSLS